MRKSLRHFSIFAFVYFRYLYIVHFLHHEAIKLGLNEYSEFLLPFELLFRDVKGEDLCNENMFLIKARLLDTALTSYQNFSSDRDLPENLTPSEFKALKRLSRNKTIVIQKADKCDTVVILI